MKHDFKDALKEYENLSHNCFVMPTEETHEAIRLALRIADKVMQEPSEEAYRAAMKAYSENEKDYPDFFNYIFRAMIEQMLKEIGDE